MTRRPLPRQPHLAAGPPLPLHPASHYNNCSRRMVVVECPLEGPHVGLSRVVVQQFRVIPGVRRVIPENVTNSTSVMGIP